MHDSPAKRRRKEKEMSSRKVMLRRKGEIWVRDIAGVHCVAMIPAGLS